MREVLPPEVAKWQYIEEKARTVLDAFAYREVRTRVVADDGALRAPGPAPLARAYVAAARWLREPVTRFYQLGPVFAAAGGKGKIEERPHLAGAVFGGAGAAVDAEVIAMLAGFLAEAGVPAAPTVTTLAAPDEAGRARHDEVRRLLAALQVETAAGPGAASAELSFVVAAAGAPLIRGGRDDHLVPGLGGPAVPAFTFTVDLTALVAAVPDPAESFGLAPAVLLTARGPSASDWALITAHRLRLGGLRVEVGDAAAGRARLVVVARDEELARGLVGIEDLATGVREEVAKDDLEAVIRMRLD
jgi:histidyl-tRNA synthetase